MDQIIEGLRRDFCNVSDSFFLLELLFTFIMGCFIWSVIIAILTRNEKTYKEGWIDGKNGVEKFHLKKQPNGETTWEEIDLEENLIEDRKTS